MLTKLHFQWKQIIFYDEIPLPLFLSLSLFLSDSFSHLDDFLLVKYSVEHRWL